jgi:glutathione synthase/RimK-type ligase-like ATP-grasp enzyme
MLFQAYVPKRSELRVTVVGERVFAAEIGSQATHHTRHDWRRYDMAHTPHTPHALPEPVARAAVALVRALGLVYGAIDLVLTPDGDYVFLEINPNGQYLWIEHLTGLPITAAIADHLIGAEPA